MRGVWAFVAVVCGVIAIGTLGSLLRGAQSGFGFRGYLLILIGLAMLYTAWRATLRALRPSSMVPATPSRRLVGSLVAAIILMSVSFVVGLYLAESGDWGGENGVLSWTVMLLGHGLRVAAVRLQLRGLIAVADLVQCALLVTIFYRLGSWWAGRRVHALEAMRRPFSPAAQKRARTALATMGVVLAVGTIAAIAMYFALRGRNLVSTYEGSKGVESFQIRPTRGEVLWRIEAPPGRVLERLRYGEVPEGFRQVVPKSGRPRPFHKGESLMVQVLTPDRIFDHYGRGVGGDRFVSGITSSGPRKFPNGLSLDQVRRAIELLFPVGTSMPLVRGSMENQGFACREIKAGMWNDQVHDFLACRRVEVGPSGERQWEVAFFSSGGKLEEFVLRNTPIEQSAR